MGRRISRRDETPTEIRLGELVNTSFCDLMIKLPDDRIGKLVSGNSKVFRILINNKIEEIPSTGYKDWIVLT